MADKPKQPPNAFIIFLQKEKKKDGNKLNKNELKERWENLSHHEKNVKLIFEGQLFQTTY